MTVKTYFRINNQFVAVREYPEKKLPDPDYIEGAILCRQRETDILCLEHWDLVDQLWCYIIAGINAISKGNPFKTMFPDQPLLMEFAPLSAYALSVTIGDNSYKVNRSIFIKEMCEEALYFFEKLNYLVPESKTTWDRYIVLTEQLASS